MDSRLSSSPSHELQTPDTQRIPGGFPWRSLRFSKAPSPNLNLPLPPASPKYHSHHGVLVACPQTVLAAFLFLTTPSQWVSRLLCISQMSPAFHSQATAQLKQSYLSADPATATPLASCLLPGPLNPFSIPEPEQVFSKILMGTFYMKSFIPQSIYLGSFWVRFGTED